MWMDDDCDVWLFDVTGTAEVYAAVSTLSLIAARPSSSVRSAIEGLGRGKCHERLAQLLRIADGEGRRLDRLVSDISEASRVDAQLSRTLFEAVDVGIMIESMLAARAARVEPGTPHPRVAFARPRKGTTVVMGDGHRLERAIDNVIANAISFSQAGEIGRDQV